MFIGLKFATLTPHKAQKVASNVLGLLLSSAKLFISKGSQHVAENST